MATGTKLDPAGRWRRPPRPATVLRVGAVAALVAVAAALTMDFQQRLPDSSTSTTNPGAESPAATPSPAASAAPAATPLPTPAAASPWQQLPQRPGTAPSRLPIPAGMVGVPVVLGVAPALAVVHTGDRVDLLAVPEEGEPATLVEDAAVLDLDRFEVTLLLALTPDQAQDVLASRDRFAVLVRP